MGSATVGASLEAETSATVSILGKGTTPALPKPHWYPNAVIDMDDVKERHVSHFHSKENDSYKTVQNHFFFFIQPP